MNLHTSNTQIVILAGGKGKRMNNDSLPKALVPFNGKPMIEYLMDAVVPCAVRKPLVVVGHFREMVMEYLGDRATYVVQEEQLGTGHAVKITGTSIDPSVDTVLVLYADQPSVTTAMVSNLINTHASSITPLTMATVTVPHFDDWYQVFYRGFSRIVRGVDGQIIKSVEFKDATDEEKNIRELNPAYFCFDRQWLFDNLETIKNENNQGEYYLTDLVKIAATNGGIASVPISPEEALGVNSIEELERLEQLQKNKD